WRARAVTPRLTLGMARPQLEYGSMLRIAAVLVSCTALRRRIWRFRLVLFLVRMWRLYAPPRLMLPEPRMRKRFAAPRLDFILGMTAFLLSFRMTPGGWQRQLLKPRQSL